MVVRPLGSSVKTTSNGEGVGSSLVGAVAVTVSIVSIMMAFLRWSAQGFKSVFKTARTRLPDMIFDHP